jgi:hypothetical protein
MSGLFNRKRGQKVGQLTYPRHYIETAEKAPDSRRELTLLRAFTDGSLITLIYRWEAELSWDEADRLDTRARAYITCAVYDVVVAVGLKCTPGPNHGIRPTWRIGKDSFPLTLVDAGFDVSDRTCFMRIGPPAILMGQPHVIGHAEKLVTGFESEFSKLTA